MMRTRILATLAAISLATAGLGGCASESVTIDASAEFPAVTLTDKAAPSIAAGKGTPPRTTRSRVLRDGEGAKVTARDTLCVDYVGALWNGTVFDQSFQETSGPRVVSLTQVVPGWKQELAGKRVGDTVEIVVSPDAGYGNTPQKDSQGKVTIPAGSTLVFVVHILGRIDPTDTSALTQATVNRKAELPAWLSVTGALGHKPTIAVKAGTKPPTESRLIILAEGKGRPIDADDYVAAHMSVYSFGSGTQTSTWDRGSMTVTDGPVSQSTLYTGIRVGTRAVILSPPGENSEGERLPGAVYVIDYGAKMAATRTGGDSE